MKGKYNFDPGKYEGVFAEMFGSNAWQEGMAEASLLGRTNAEVDFAKQLYMARLKAAEEAAAARRRGGRRGGGGDKESKPSYNTTQKGNKLLDEFLGDKEESQYSPSETYPREEKERMGVSLARNVPIVPIAQNRNLDPLQKMRYIQEDAAYQKRSRR